MKIYPIVRALLFRLNPELAHKLTINAIRVAGDIRPIGSLLRSSYSAPPHPVSAFGLSFINPIGLAAGYDKDGLGWRGLACLGFGHIEVGTVTPKPQPGNPKPRIFRLPEEKALINRMGFPGKGSEYVLQQITKKRPKDLILGVNIGKNKDTPLDTAVFDYIYLIRMFAGRADYLTVNVSSPNTVGLRQLQERKALAYLLEKINKENESVTRTSSHKTPILVKISPDLTDAELDDALEAILENHIDGVIATNTTITRVGLKSVKANETGGLSGAPLFERSLLMIKKIHDRTDGKLPVIGVGGLYDTSGVQKMMDVGAVLVQIYTGLIYTGPGLVKQILRELQA